MHIYMLKYRDEQGNGYHRLMVLVTFGEDSDWGEGVSRAKVTVILVTN